MMNRSAIISIPGNRKKDSCVQVLQVHKARFVDTQGDEHLPDGIYVCHAPLGQTLNDYRWINKEIDAVIVGPDCGVSDIVAIREIASRQSIPLILQTLKFDWKAKEIALESEVDDYHIGFLDQNFIKRILLIKRIKSFSKSVQNGKTKRQLKRSPSLTLYSLKRSFDITVSLLVVLSLIPVLCVIVPLLMIETKGSILTTSKRVGRNYRVFDLYKFACISSVDSKRVDLVRRFLRKAHLVGLPQLLNVLIGNMSLVGNYPVHEREAERLTKDEFAWRFLAPVGIVGLWRFSSIEENKTQEWRSDIEYARANSIWLDIKILFFHAANLLTAKLHGKAKYWVSSFLEREEGRSISAHHNFIIPTN